MPWLRVDDELFLHPKWIATPPTARALWITALSYAGKFSNGGSIHPALLPMLGGTVDDAEALVVSGLWEKREDGYQIHNFEEYNASSTPEAKAHLSEVRSAAGKAGAEAKAKQNLAKRKQNLPPSPDPVPSPSTEREGLAVEKHGSIPESELPPPLDAQEQDCQNGLTASEAHLRPLFAAFRSVRFPKSIPENAPRAEWQKALPWLRMAHEAGASVDAMCQATRAAMRRWRSVDMVTIKSVAEHWTELLESDPVEAPRDGSRTKRPRGETMEEARAAIRRDFDVLQDDYLAGGYVA